MAFNFPDSWGPFPGAQFPYTQTGALNMDWVLTAVKSMQQQLALFIEQNALSPANPIEWSITNQYPQNKIVTHKGQAFISKRPVPAGIDIYNEDYWIPAFQFEQADVPFFYPESYGAVGDGITDDYTALQACIDAAAGKGVVYLQTGSTYRSNQSIAVPSDTYIYGYGATMLFPSSHGLQNVSFGDPPTATDSNICIFGVTFSSNGTSDGQIRLSGIKNAAIRDCSFTNIKPDGVTTGLSLTNGCCDVSVLNCSFECPDYAIIATTESGTKASATLYNSNINITGCRISTDWGSAIALQGGGKNITISDCNIYVTGGSDNVGIGIKINEGVSADYNVHDVLIANCSFAYTTAGSTNNAAISIGNYNNNIIINGCSFNGFYNTITPNYTNGTLKLTVSDCNAVGRGISNSPGFINATKSANVTLNLSNCTVDNIGQAVTGGAYIDSSVNGLIVTNAGRAISLTSANMFTIVGVIASACTQPAINITSPVSGAVLNIIGCSFNECSPGASVLNLTSANACIIGCNISTQKADTKPTYAVSSAGRVVISGCFLYGFQTGYYNLTDSSSITTGNIERGGIG